MIDLQQGDAVQWALSALYFCVCFSVARKAKRFEIGERVGFNVSFNPEETKRDFMVNMLTNVSATLASLFVSRKRLAFLGLPISPAPIVCAVNKLRVIFLDAVSVTAKPRTVFTNADMPSYSAVGFEKNLAAIEAGKLLTGGELFKFTGFVLALSRTVFTTSVFRAGCGALKTLAAMRASTINLFFRRGVFGSYSYITLSHANNRAIMCLIDSIRLYLKLFSTSFAVQCNHAFNYKVMVGIGQAWQ